MSLDTEPLFRHTVPPDRINGRNEFHGIIQQLRDVRFKSLFTERDDTWYSHAIQTKNTKEWFIVQYKTSGWFTGNNEIYYFHLNHSVSIQDMEKLFLGSKIDKNLFIPNNQGLSKIYEKIHIFNDEDTLLDYGEEYVRKTTYPDKRYIEEQRQKKIRYDRQQGDDQPIVTKTSYDTRFGPQPEIERYAPQQRNKTWEDGERGGKRKTKRRKSTRKQSRRRRRKHRCR
jgi:hypothetical protein